MAHFGGGSDEEGSSNQKDRKTVIEELIAESKKRKIEKLRENEEIFEKTKALDDDWKDLVSIVNTMRKSDEDKEKSSPDDYDRVVKEMVFEPRGEPAEKLKSEEEVARLEKQKLENLERERLFRMRGDESEEPKISHRSADDLDDGYFAAEAVDENDESNKIIGYEIDEPKDLQSNDEESQEIVERSEAESEDDQEDSAEEEQSSNEEDSLEDLKADSDEEETSNCEIKQVKQPEKVKKAEISEPVKELKENNELKSIPYTIQMPKSYEDFSKLLDKNSPETQTVIIERIIKTNHQRLLKQNREKMIEVFAYLMQFINDQFVEADGITVEKCFKALDLLTLHFYELAQMNPLETSKCFQEVVKEKYETFKKSPKVYPGLDCLVFFKLLGSIFPTSDFRHPVVTPCFVFIHHILSEARVKSRSDVASGLFLVNLILDHQTLARRFLPSAMNYLHGICYLGVRKSIVDVLKPVPPFKKNPSFDSLLVMGEQLLNCRNFRISSKDLVKHDVDDSFKVRALHLIISLIRDFCELYEDHVGVKYLVEPFVIVLKRLSDEDYFPVELKSHLKEVLSKLECYENDKRFTYPVQEEKKLKMLRMLEPKIETVYCDRRQMFSVGGEAKAEQQKLKRQVKREFKDAKRELRRDNEFLAKLQLKRKIQRYFILLGLCLYQNNKLIQFFSAIESDRKKLKEFLTKHRYNRVNLMHWPEQKEEKPSFNYTYIFLIKIYWENKFQQ